MLPGDGAESVEDEVRGYKAACMCKRVTEIGMRITRIGLDDARLTCRWSLRRDRRYSDLGLIGPEDARHLLV